MIKLGIINHTQHPTPSKVEFNQWLTAAIHCPATIDIAILTTEAIKKINLAYRHKNQATNILSFTYNSQPLIGELLFCPEIIIQEAQAQAKPVINHWAHLTVHGALHLLGYDHIKETDAQIMQAKEIAILNQLGINNPYAGLPT